MTAVEGKASVYQVYPVSRTTGEGRAEFQGRGGLDLNKREQRWMLIISFEGTGISSGVWFRFGRSMGFLELEFLGQIASFERRLLEAVLTPLTVPYPFRTWT